jgi:hypothetical protein
MVACHAWARRNRWRGLNGFHPPVFLSAMHLFLIQRLPHFGGQISSGEGLLDEMHPFIQDAVVGDVLTQIISAPQSSTFSFINSVKPESSSIINIVMKPP